MPEPADTSASNSSKASLTKVLGVLDRTAEHIEEFILGGSVLFLSGLLIVHVLGRQIFGTGVTGQVELTRMSMVIMTFAGLGYGVRKARHISMSAFYDQLRGKPRKLLLMFIHIVTGALMFYLAWHAWDYVSAIQDRGRRSSALQIPLWIPYMAAPVGFALAGIQYWLTVARNLISKDTYRSFSEKERYDEVPNNPSI
ncbi:TRAP-type C4-dicarboxylate transport system, small permease component [Halopseudomonas xinjiangensis]|uniref:TRAP transporter small permease protein n=1 Tax=Halopseudomonas xinjiangensis TaxID=487184 RepID=A0A1H1TER3_9GAMM|nr:TRAP transporter small permease [Halopseudomonas xinjiangensis]SDS58678.1 TRAP-type C4-dicarboxylate transport system, small permease component [Halopseudomonas xinjiangensis]